MREIEQRSLYILIVQKFKIKDGVCVVMATLVMGIFALGINIVQQKNNVMLEGKNL